MRHKYGRDWYPVEDDKTPVKIIKTTAEDLAEMLRESILSTDASLEAALMIKSVIGDCVEAGKVDKVTIWSLLSAEEKKLYSETLKQAIAQGIELDPVYQRKIPLLKDPKLNSDMQSQSCITFMLTKNWQLGKWVANRKEIETVIEFSGKTSERAIVLQQFLDDIYLIDGGKDKRTVKKKIR